MRILLYVIHGIRRQHDGIGIRAETDFRRGRDHHLVPDTRREVRQQQRGRTRAYSDVAQDVPADAALHHYLVTGYDAVVRVLRWRVPFQVHRAGVVRGRLDVLRWLGRACSRGGERGKKKKIKTVIFKSKELGLKQLAAKTALTVLVGLGGSRVRRSAFDVLVERHQEKQITDRRLQRADHVGPGQLRGVR